MRTLVLVAALFLQWTSAQKFTVPQLSNFFPHATDSNLLALVKGMNSDTTVKARKDRINTWAITDKKAGNVTNPTYTLYDNKNYSVKKAQVFVDQREAMKKFIAQTVLPWLQKDNYLTEAQTKKLVPMIWMLDDERHGSDVGGSIFFNWMELAVLEITDFSKRELFYGKMMDLTRSLKGKDPSGSNLTFGWSPYDREFQIDQYSRYPIY